MVPSFCTSCCIFDMSRSDRSSDFILCSITAHQPSLPLFSCPDIEFVVSLSVWAQLFVVFMSVSAQLFVVSLSEWAQLFVVSLFGLSCL